MSQNVEAVKGPLKELIRKDGEVVGAVIGGERLWYSIAYANDKELRDKKFTDEMQGREVEVRVLRHANGNSYILPPGGGKKDGARWGGQKLYGGRSPEELALQAMDIIRRTRVSLVSTLADRSGGETSPSKIIEEARSLEKYVLEGLELQGFLAPVRRTREASPAPHEGAGSASGSGGKEAGRIDRKSVNDLLSEAKKSGALDFKGFMALSERLFQKAPYELGPEEYRTLETKVRKEIAAKKGAA